MMKNLNVKFKNVGNLMIILVLFMTGCAGSVTNMKEIPDSQGYRPTPEPGKALVVFMRPSGLGFAIQSSVFILSDKQPDLVGIVATQKKVAFSVKPGKHIFMVIGESADFMNAEVEKGKTYYALVTPRWGVWKARFSLKPIHKNQLNSKEMSEWVSSTRWVEKTKQSENWAKSNMSSIQEKEKSYMKKWLEKPPANRPFLRREDGLQ